MLVSTVCKINWHPKHREYYEEKGYIFNGYKNTFKIKVKDLKDNSKAHILAKCDYCDKMYIIKYVDYAKCHKNIINKDACGLCRMLKANEAIIIKYGIDNVFRLSEIKNKIFPKRKLENNPNWNGGKSDLDVFLRSQLVGWKIKSLMHYNKKCVITNKKPQVVHHLYSLNLITKECLDELNLDNKKFVNKYTIDEIKNIIDLLLEKHYKLPFGVPLVQPIHNLFHKLYGNGNNTIVQFEEFKTRLIMGEFDYFLEENNLKLAI